MSMLLSFGEILSSLRKGLGLTQEELSRHLGLSRSAIGMYEKNEREPNFHTVREIAAFFRVDVNTLYGLKKPGEDSMGLDSLMRERPLLRTAMNLLTQMDDAQLAIVLSEIKSTMADQANRK